MNTTQEAIMDKISNRLIAESEVFLRNEKNEWAEKESGFTIEENVYEGNYYICGPLDNWFPIEDDEVFIYTIGNDEVVKIGSTRNIRQRLAQIRTGASSKIWVLGFSIGHKEDEKEMHYAFSELRLQGEWFRRDGVIDILLPGKGRTLAEQEGFEFLSYPLNEDSIDYDRLANQYRDKLLSYAYDLLVEKATISCR